MFCRLVDAYDWDFCQIQYNYMDEHSQTGRRGLLYAHEKGLPVIIMEPLRGGKLASRLPDKAIRIFRNYPVSHTPVQWALRWLWNQPEVTCTGCGYCMPCPSHVDIPGTFSAYNHRYSEGRFSALTEYFMCTGMRKTSSAASCCIQCGRCEQHCPQHIKIRRELKNARRKLEGPLYKIARAVVKLMKAY